MTLNAGPSKGRRCSIGRTTPAVIKISTPVEFWYNGFMNNTKFIAILIVVALVVVGVYMLENRNATAPVVSMSGQTQTSFDPMNATYNIDGKAYALVNGVSEVEAAPGSASKITTRYFGNQASGDLNGDGVPDYGFLITQDGGGSGTFFYAVAAIKTSSGYQMTNAYILGDRIAPQTTEIMGQELVVNYADRNPGEPMTAQPSLGVSKYFKVTPDNQLLEITP